MAQVNILFRVKVQAGREQEFYKLVAEMMKSTREEDEGCITFIYHQHAHDLRDFFLYEQWRDRDAVKAHIDRLIRVYGPPKEGQGLPAFLTDFFDEMHVDPYNVVE